jgi:hypothetical protein
MSDRRLDSSGHYWVLGIRKNYLIDKMDDQWGYFEDEYEKIKLLGIEFLGSVTLQYKPIGDQAELGVVRYNGINYLLVMNHFQPTTQYLPNYFRNLYEAAKSIWSEEFPLIDYPTEEHIGYEEVLSFQDFVKRIQGLEEN